MRERGNKVNHWSVFTYPVDIVEWNHFCIGYSIVTNQPNAGLRTVRTGGILVTDWLEQTTPPLEEVGREDGLD